MSAPYELRNASTKLCNSVIFKSPKQAGLMHLSTVIWQDWPTDSLTSPTFHHHNCWLNRPIHVSLWDLAAISWLGGQLVQQTQVLKGSVPQGVFGLSWRAASNMNMSLSIFQSSPTVSYTSSLSLSSSRSSNDGAFSSCRFVSRTSTYCIWLLGELKTASGDDFLEMVNNFDCIFNWSNRFQTVINIKVPFDSLASSESSPMLSYAVLLEQLEDDVGPLKWTSIRWSVGCCESGRFNP